ncbi:MAG: c-type cytochrome [Pseudohongiellaceae bacterium]
MNQAALLVTTATIALGGLLLWGTFGSQPPSAAALATAPALTPEYGEELLRHTSLHLGAGQQDPSRRYAGNNLDCSSCHLESGRKPGNLSLLQSAAKYPTFSGRDGKVGDLADRINGCMQRSMAGRLMPKDSLEMQAMVLYVEQLGRQYAAMGESSRQAVEPAAFVEPARAADLDHGGAVYRQHCQVCHGLQGEGLKETGNIADGYLFPPLWGPDSYNIGAGMARVLTAARFIKARMPLGNPLLTDDEAFDVAAYMNAQPRPAMADLERDYPDRTLKPVDSPYPPYADAFPVDQHRIGPYAPIREAYQKP